MISVVIPALNEEKLIGKCLESIKAQDYPGDYEIIVVDNGSDDSTTTIARSLGASVISVPVRGVTLARQAGADAARGEVIVQADADTTYPRWWLSRIRRQFDTHPGSVAVAGTFIYDKPAWWAPIEYCLRVSFGHLSNLVFRKPLIISGANFAFYKKAFVRIGGYDPKAYSADQIDISGRLRGTGKILYDGRSYGATSTRSVEKPLLRLARDFGRNLHTFARHTFRTSWANARKRSKGVSPVSPGTYLNIAVPLFLIGTLVLGHIPMATI